MICQVPHCQLTVSREDLFLCRQHWDRLPTSLKDRVYRWAWKKSKDHEGAEQGYEAAKQAAIERASE
jgi:hypothetical protein